MDNEGQFRPFSSQLSTLEETFDVLSEFVRTGGIVVHVHLLDNGLRTPLPSEAFDGEPIASHIRKLEVEWTTLLNESVNPQSATHQLLTSCSGRLHETYQTRIDWLEAAIRKTEGRIHRLPRTAYWESCYIRFEMQMTLYRKQLKQAKAGQRRVSERLSAYLDY